MKKHAPSMAMAFCLLSLTFTGMAAELQMDRAVVARIWQAQRHLSDLLQRESVEEQELLKAGFDLCLVMHSHGLAAAAKRCYRGMIDLMPDDFRWHHLLGRLLGDSRRSAADLALAAQSYRRALALNPEFIPTAVSLAEVERNLGNDTQAERIYRQVLVRDPDNAVTHAGLGKLLLKRNEAEQAVSHLQQALRAQPQATRLHYSLAMALRALGNEDEAERQLARSGDRSVVQPDPLLALLDAVRTGAIAQLYEGDRQLVRKNYAAALNAYKEAARLDSGNVAVRIKLASIHLIFGERDAAMRVLNEVGQLDSGNARAHYLRSIVYAMAGEEDEAYRAVRRSVELDGNDPSARLVLGHWLMRRAQADEAIANYRVAQQLAPHNIEAHVWLAKALVWTGSISEAGDVLFTATRMFPDSIEVLDGLLRLYAVYGPVEQATRVIAGIAQRYRNRRPREEDLPVAALACALSGDFDCAEEFRSGLGDDGTELDSVFALLRQGKRPGTSWLADNGYFWPVVTGDSPSP